MDYPEAVIEKAKRLEQLLQRVAAGEGLGAVGAEMGISLTKKQLKALQKKYRAGGQCWQALLDGRYGHPIKANSAIRAWLYERRRQEAEVRSPQLAQEVAAKFGVELTPEHINYLLRQRGLTAPVGRPFKKKEVRAAGTEPAPPAASSLENAGLFFPGSSQRSAGGKADD